MSQVQVPPLYTVDEYFALVDAGALSPDDRVELLEGVVVDMSPQTARHASAVGRVRRALESAFGEGVVIRDQVPWLASSRSGPEPDLVVVPGKWEDYDTRHPSEALLVLEVADTSLRQDRLTKARIYAEAGVPDYWLINLVDDVVEVHRSPDTTERRYREVTVVRPGETLTPLSAPGSVLVADLIPGRE